MSRPRSRTATASAVRKTGTIQVGERVGGSHGPLTAPYRGAQGRITGLPRYRITGRDSKARMVVQTSFLTMSSIVTPLYEPYQLFAFGRAEPSQARTTGGRKKTLIWSEADRVQTEISRHA